MADSTTLIRDAVDNFDKLDLLIRKIDKFVQIGFLSEAQSMIVLGIYVYMGIAYYKPYLSSVISPEMKTNILYSTQNPLQDV